MTAARSASESKPASASRCLVPNCGGPSERRGNCRNCYASFWRQVKLGKITWKKLINAGLTLPAERGKVSLAAKAVRKIKSTAAASK